MCRIQIVMKHPCLIIAHRSTGPSAWKSKCRHLIVAPESRTPGTTSSNVRTNTGRQIRGRAQI